MTEENTQAGMAGQSSATLGTRLQGRREELGWTLEDIESRLKIRRTILQAIEGERYSELPDKVYALGFIKSYARFLGLDTEDIMQQANSELASLLPKRQTVNLDLPGPQAERSAGLWVLLAIGLIVIIGGYAGWYHFYAHGRLGASIFPSHLTDKITDDAGHVPQAAGTASPASVAANAPALGAPSASTSVPTSPPALPSAQPARPVGSAQPKDGAEKSDNGQKDNDKKDNAQQDNGQKEDSQKDMPDLPPPPEAVSPASDGSSAAAGQGQAHPAETASTEKPQQTPAVSVPSPAEKPVSQNAAGEEHKAETQASVVSHPQSFAPVAPPVHPAPASAPVSGKAADTAKAKQDSGGVVRIHALEDSWVHVVDASGKSLIGHVLKKGDVWQGDPGATYHVTSGNAGGVVLQAGNVVSAPLGLRGKIARDVVVNAALVEQGRYGHGSLSTGVQAPKAHR